MATRMRSPKVALGGQPKVALGGGQLKAAFGGQPKVALGGKPTVAFGGKPTVALAGQPKAALGGKPTVALAGQPKVALGGQQRLPAFASKTNGRRHRGPRSRPAHMPRPAAEPVASRPFFSEEALAFIAKYNKICNTDAASASAPVPAPAPADITKEFMGLLNKLTDKNYDKIFAKIKQSIAGAPIEFIAKEIYNKSLFDTNYHLQYATLAKDIWDLTGTKAQMMNIFHEYFATRHEYMGKEMPENEYSTNFCIKRHYLTIMQLYGTFYRIGEIDDDFAIQLIGELLADAVADANAEEIDMLAAFVSAVGDFASERLTEYIASVVRTIKAPSKRHEYILMNMTATALALTPAQATVLRDDDDVGDFLSKSTFGPFIIEDPALYDELYGQLFMWLLGKEQARLLPLLHKLKADGEITDEQIAQQISLIEDNLEDIMIDEPNAARYLVALEAHLL